MIAWSRALIDAYCSSWTVIQTLELFNGFDAKWMNGRQDWCLLLSRSTVYLSEQRLDEQRPPNCSEQLRDVQSVLGERIRWLDAEALRYCPACIQVGRHYQYQQDDRFVRCVLHRVRLKTGCPSCGVALDTKGTLVHGFTCKSCGSTLLESDVSGELTARKAASYARTLDKLHQWLRTANDSLAGCQRAHSGLTTIRWNGNHAVSNAGSYWYALIQLPNTMVRNALLPTPTSFTQRPKTALLLPLPADDHETAIRPYEELLRCIARQIRRTYLRGHSSCRVHAMRTVGGGRTQRNRWAPVTLRPHLCCRGQAYAVWLLQRREELREISERMSVSRMDRLLGHRRSEVPMRLPDLHATASSYISSFEAWIANLARLHSLIDRSNRQSVLYEQFRCSPNWALHQPGASKSCPIHLRLDQQKNRAYCDRGRVRQEDLAYVIALGRERERILKRVDKMRDDPTDITPDILL